MTLFEEVRIFKVRENSKLPVRAHPTDAGMDLFYCPDGGVKFTTLLPGESKLFSTGLKIQVPSNHMLQIMNKSGIASKRSLIVGACVVDEGYTGEVFVNLHNIGKHTQIIEAGNKLAQGVFVKIEKPPFKVVKNSEDLYGEVTSRGSGSLGSTGDI